MYLVGGKERQCVIDILELTVARKREKSASGKK